LGLRGRLGWVEVVVVAVDGIADGVASAGGAEGVDVFVLGETDGLEERLRQVGDGAGGSGFFISPRTTAGMRRARAALRSQAER